MASIRENRYIAPAAEGDARLSDYFAVVIESWRLIAGVAAVVLVLGTIYAFLARPVFRADALIQVEDNASSTKDALGELTSLFDTKQTAIGEIELIRSRLVVAQTVQQLHLDISAAPRHFPLIGALIARREKSGSLARPLLGLSRFAWGGESINVPLFNVPETLYDKRFILRSISETAYELHDPDGNLVVRGTVGKTAQGMTDLGDFQIRVDALVARPGTQFVIVRSSTLGTVDKLQQSLTIAEKTKQSGVIAVTLDGEDRERTAATVNAIARAYVQQNIDRKSAEAQQTLSFLDQQLPQLRRELDQAEDRYNAFRNKNGTVDLTEESRLLLQQIVESKTKLVDLQQQRVEMTQRFTPSHPGVTALSAQIDALQARESELNHRVASLPNTEQSALRLLRDVRVDTELYTNLLNSAQQLKIVKAGELGNVRVVDYAVVADEPIRPKRPTVIGFAAVFGVIVGVLSAFLRKALYGGVEHIEEIEQLLGLAVYAVVPHSEAQIRLNQSFRRGREATNYVLAAVAPEDAAIEGVRSLRTALQFGQLDAKNNIVVITGPRPEAGKSFLSVNLSAVLASSGQRVLLIDADMRRGDAHTYFAVSAMPGLSDVIAGHEIDDAILHNLLPGLDVLPKGSLPPNPAELLMGGRFKSVLEDLSTRYDTIIVDTPPVLAVTDPTIIGKHAGTTLLVVRHGKHPVAEIAESAKRLSSGGVALKGVLFTDVPQRRIGYGAYYSGYYGYESRLE